MKIPFGKGAGPFGHASLLTISVVLFFFSLAIGFVTGFPTDVLRDRLLQEITAQTGFAASSKFLQFGFPAEVSLDLTIDPNHPQVAPLEFDKLEVRPVWSSLLSSDRSVDLQGRIAGGDFEAQVGASGDLSADIRGMRLAPLQKQQNPYRIDGFLQADLNGSQMLRPGSADGIFSAKITGLEVFGLEKLTLPEKVPLGQLSLEGKLNGQRLNLNKVVLDGDFAGVTGSGTIQIGATPRQTRLNLRITAKPGAAFPASLKPLIELSGIKPKADGSYHLRISGTLARPTVR